MKKMTDGKFIAVMGGLMLISVLLLSGGGCATAPAPMPPETITEPVLSVQPEKIRLGVARLAKETEIVFRGWGFAPHDSVFISLTPVANPDTFPIAIADAVIDETGHFETEVDSLVKITEFLQADIGLNADMEKYIIVSRDPLATGVYQATAETMESDETASCRLTIKGPSLMDRLKDWLGARLGKIRNVPEN